MLAGLVEIVVEVFVQMPCPLGRFYEDEAHGLAGDVGARRFVPVYLPLVVAHVYAVDGEPLGIGLLSVHGLPFEAVRCDEIDVDDVAQQGRRRYEKAAQSQHAPLRAPFPPPRFLAGSGRLALGVRGFHGAACVWLCPLSLCFWHIVLPQRVLCASVCLGYPGARPVCHAYI